MLDISGKGSVWFGLKAGKFGVVRGQGSNPAGKQERYVFTY